MALVRKNIDGSALRACTASNKEPTVYMKKSSVIRWLREGFKESCLRCGSKEFCLRCGLKKNYVVVGSQEVRSRCGPGSKNHVVAGLL